VEVIDFGVETTYNIPAEGQLLFDDEVQVQNVAKETKQKNHNSL